MFWWILWAIIVNYTAWGRGWGVDAVVGDKVWGKSSHFPLPSAQQSDPVEPHIAQNSKSTRKYWIRWSLSFLIFSYFCCFQFGGRGVAVLGLPLQPSALWWCARACLLLSTDSTALKLSSCSSQALKLYVDLSSLRRDWTHISCIGRWILNHWITREVLVSIFKPRNEFGKCQSFRESDTTEATLHACMPALEKEMATHSSILAWRVPGTEEPGGLPSMGSHRVRYDWSDLAAAAAELQREEVILL